MKQERLINEAIDEASPRADLRERILTRASTLFSSRGIRSITMDDIAASLSISKRTLYEVFQDKESLLKECILTDHHEMTLFLKEVLVDSKNVLEVILACYKRVIEKFHHTNRLFFEDIKRYPAVYAMVKSFHEKDSNNTVAFFQMGVEQGMFRDDVNFAIVNMLVHEQLNTLINTDLCKEYSFIEVYESIMFTYIRGISTEKGAKELETFIQEYRIDSMKQEQQ